MSTLRLRPPKLLLASVVSACTLVAGCYGSFTLTKKVYDWNGEASDNKFVVWLVFLGLNVIPVYGIAVAVDALIMNSVEFWTGENPAGIATRVEKNADGTATVYRGDEVYQAVPVSKDRVELYKGNERIGVATISESGEMVVMDEKGDVRLEKAL
jgi:hypothetical protein